MALNPETLFSECFSFPGLTGGADYISKFIASVQYTEYMHIGKLLSFDCSDFNENVNVSVATAYHKKIYEFENGVYFGIRLYMTPAHDNVPTHVRGESYITNGTTFTVKNAYINGWNSTGAYVSASALKLYGIKCFLVTNYITEAITQGGAMFGLTKADSVSLKCIIPYQSGSALQSWLHISSDDQQYVLSDADTPEAAFTLPYGFYYGTSRVDGQAFTFSIATYTDLTALKNDVNGFGGDPLPDTKIVNKSPLPGENPSQDDDPSTPGGGGGSYKDQSDPIDYPSLPTGGAISTGSIKSFLVDVQRVQDIFQRLWNSSLFDVVTWQKIIEEPLDSIVSLTCIPCLPATSGAGHVQLGNIDTEVTAPIISNQYITIDCGTLKVDEFWGSALDYSPYTKIDCYLPFIGIRPLKAEDVINQTIGIKYNMDILTGNLSASIKCGQSVLYKFQGNAKASVPLTSRIFSALEAVMKGAGFVANSYAIGAMAASARENATPQSVDAAATYSAAGAAINSAINVAMSKVQIQRSGDLSGAAGLLDDFTPYLIIHRPQQSLAGSFKTYKGYPSNISATLSSLTGYTEVEYIHLTGINSATDAELNEIEGLLKSGVII